MSEDNGKQTTQYKVKAVAGPGGSAFGRYRSLCYGDTSLWHFIKCELLVTLLSPVPGALGLWLRGRLYRCMFRRIGRKVVFGRNLTVRHPHKIELGDGVILDDNVVIDAKGESNRGIEMGDGVYVGRNTIVYCKDGDLRIEARANISSNCQLFSSHELTVGADTVIGAFTYLLSGGAYDYTDRERTFSEQAGTTSQGPVRIGRNCWLAARVTVLDGAGVGDHCVIGAGAVVTAPVPAESIAVGVPARVVKSLLPGDRDVT